MSTQSEIQAVSLSEAETLFAEIEAGRDRLAPVELDIVQSLRERPFRTWCIGCHKMLRVLHAKATDRDWRELLCQDK